MRVLPVLALAVRAQEAVSLYDERRERLNQGSSMLVTDVGDKKNDEFRTF